MSSEQNPDFLTVAEEAAGGKSKVILICNLGDYKLHVNDWPC